jgi:hypothetical protein
MKGGILSAINELSLIIAWVRDIEKKVLDQR